MLLTQASFIIPDTSISIVLGRIKLRRVPGQNEKIEITKYPPTKIDYFPKWRVVIDPKR
jgi:hypothetical protein